MRPFVQGPERKLIARANGPDEHDLDQPFAVASCTYPQAAISIEIPETAAEMQP
jgi:hypothetical protein